MFSINDKNDWKIVRKAFSIIDFTEKDLEVWKSKVHPSDGKSCLGDVSKDGDVFTSMCRENWHCSLEMSELVF